MERIILKDELKDLIPHKGKMFLIDRITEYNIDDWSITSQTDITESFMFYDHNIKAVPSYSVFELAAQSVSALTGLYTKINNLSVNMGMILSVSKMHFDIPLITPGCTVTVKAWREAAVDNIYSFTADIYINDNRCGSGKLTVMEATGGLSD